MLCKNTKLHRIRKDEGSAFNSFSMLVERRIKQESWRLVLALFVLLRLSDQGFVQADQSGRANATQPVRNAVVFLADDLGWADLGCTGSTFYETPNLDALAASGVRFTDAYAACPVCSPTRASLITGLWPQRTGITDYIGAAGGSQWNRNTKLLPADYRKELDFRFPTFAETLHALGYATFFAGKWHLGGEAYWPEHRGFDFNLGGIDRGGPYGGNKYFSPYGNPRLPDGPTGEHLPDRLAQETVRFIEGCQQQNRPFVAYLSFYSVHTPLMARHDLEQKYQRKRETLPKERVVFGDEPPRQVRLVQDHAVYAGMVEAMDQAVGKVLHALETQGLVDETLVIFTSDNGGLSTSEGSPTSNAPLRAGKGWMYEGGIRVPMIVRYPQRLPAGVVSNVPVCSIDIAPTLHELAQPESDHRYDGLPLTQLYRNSPKSNSSTESNDDSIAAVRPLFWHYPHYGNQGSAPAAAIRMGHLKLIRWYEDQREELFDLASDLGETTPLDLDQPAAQAMRQQLDAWLKEVRAEFPVTNPTYDPALPNGREAVGGQAPNRSKRKP